MGVVCVGVCREGVVGLGALGMPFSGLCLAYVGIYIGAYWAGWLATTTTKPGELGMSAWTCESLGLGLVSALLLKYCRACRI
jgi:hypothetical protein